MVSRLIRRIPPFTLLILAVLLSGCDGGTIAERATSKSPLADAAFRGDVQQLDMALQKGADVNGRDELKATPLHWACSMEGNLKFPKGDHEMCARKLLKAGAQVNAENGSRETPLYRAVMHPQLVRVLLENGADPNHGQLGRTPIISASYLGGSHCDASVESMQLLLQAGADINRQERGAGTALFSALVYGCPRMVRFLVDHGVDVNAHSTHGETALAFVKRYRSISAGDLFKANESSVVDQNIAIVRAAGGHE